MDPLDIHGGTDKVFENVISEGTLKAVTEGARDRMKCRKAIRFQRFYW